MATRTRTEKTLEERSIHGGETLTPAELSELWEHANKAMHAGSYHEAFAAVEALLVQADCRQNVCSDTLPNVAFTLLGQRYYATEGGTEMLQSLVDRVESLNWQVRHASR